MMLVSLVRAGSEHLGWSAACDRLVGAVPLHAQRMGPMHLEISAYSCSRLFRRGKGPAQEKVCCAAKVLLHHGTNRAERFVPRSLLNFFVALERILGPVEVQPLASAVARSLDRCDTLQSCSLGDRYRAALCLLRAGKEHLQAARVLIDPSTWQQLSPHARRALAR
ncbi:unnamed protein product, partial [Effrenium voratum]